MALRAEETILVADALPATGAPASSVSWAAIFAGAVAAAAATVVLVALGSGLGLTMVSPWENAGVTATTFAVSTAIYLVIVQWFAAGLGGYITGRLRRRWTDIDTDEVFFRDTAHGFLAWALATLLMVGLASSALTSVVGGAGRVAATAASGVAEGVSSGAMGDPTAYFSDALFRATGTPTPGGQTGTAVTTAPVIGEEDRAEAGRILVSGIAAGEVPAADRAYLAQLIAARTGISQADAEQRVTTVISDMQAANAKAKEAADAARKTAATASIFLALSLAVGAFIAAAAAALGGWLRDDPT